MRRFTFRCILAVAALLVCAARGNASPIGSANVQFSINGDLLTVTLTNTSTTDALAPDDILTGVFFDISTHDLKAGTATICDLCTIDGVKPASADVGSQWAFGHALGLPNDAYYGISAAGLGVFGPKNLFTPQKSGNSPGGLDYGITGSGDLLNTGNGGLANATLISNEVIFTLSGKGLDPSTIITNVSFLYGTQLPTPVPEPTTLALMGTGLLTTVLVRRRVRR